MKRRARQSSGPDVRPLADAAPFWAAPAADAAPAGEPVLFASGGFGPADAAEWDALAARHPLGSVYHLSTWRGVLERSFPHIRGCFLGLRSGAPPVLSASLALYRARSWLLGDRLVAAPYATVCEPLYDGEAALAQLASAAAGLVESTGCGWVEIKTRLGSIPAGCRAPFSVTAIHKHHFLPLDQDPGRLERGLSRTNVRQWLRRAKDAGVTVEFREDEGALAAFFSLLCATRRRLGLPRMRWSFFRALAEHLGPHAVRVSLAMHQGEAAAGLLSLRFRDCYTFEYSGQVQRKAAPGANHLVWWENICRARAEGYRFVSLGRTSLDNQGLLAFKRHWGAIEEDIATLAFRRGSAAPVRSLSEARGSRRWRLLFQRAPEPLYRALSRLLYSHWA